MVLGGRFFLEGCLLLREIICNGVASPGSRGLVVVRVGEKGVGGGGKENGEWSGM